MILCTARSTHEYLSQRMMIAPRTIGIIDIKHGVEGTLIVHPSVSVTNFNLFENGHRPLLLLARKTGEMGWKAHIGVHAGKYRLMVGSGLPNGCVLRIPRRGAAVAHLGWRTATVTG